MTITASLHGHDEPEYWRLWNGPTLIGAVPFSGVDVDGLIARCEIILAATGSLSAARIELRKANADTDRHRDDATPYNGTDPF